MLCIFVVKACIRSDITSLYFTPSEMECCVLAGVFFSAFLIYALLEIHYFLRMLLALVSSVFKKRLYILDESIMTGKLHIFSRILCYLSPWPEWQVQAFATLQQYLRLICGLLAILLYFNACVYSSTWYLLIYFQILECSHVNTFTPTK